MGRLASALFTPSMGEKSVFKRAVAAEREELKQVITSGEKAVNTEVIGDAVEKHGRRRGSRCTAAVE